MVHEYRLQDLALDNQDMRDLGLVEEGFPQDIEQMLHDMEVVERVRVKNLVQKSTRPPRTSKHAKKESGSDKNPAQQTPAMPRLTITVGGKPVKKLTPSERSIRKEGYHQRRRR